VNEQELFLRVGELATAAGYPIPSIEWTDRRGPYVAVDERGVAGPVLRLRPEVSQWCSSVQDLMIAQMLLCARFGMYRHHRQLKIWGFVLTGAVGVVLAVLYGPYAYVWALVAWVLFTGISAVSARRLLRKVDPRLVEILGPDVVLEALEHLRSPLTPVGFFRWLGAGAGALPGERITWLQASAAGNSSVAD
jgi:hypothetical protein